MNRHDFCGQFSAELVSGFYKWKYWQHPGEFRSLVARFFLFLVWWRNKAYLLFDDVIFDTAIIYKH